MSQRITRRTLAVLALLVCLAPAALAEEWTGEVVGVTDGDTIDVMRDGRSIRVRLYGVDCPESGQAFGSRAKQFTSEKAFAQTVRVVVMDTDRYGRTVGDVFLPDGKRLSNELVVAGMAWWYAEYAPRDTQLQRRHLNASTRKVGLWSDPAPIAPWDFRNGRGNAIDQSSRERSVPSQPSAPVPQSVDSQLTVPAEASITGADLVYVTNTGEKYHRDGCRYLSNSKIPIALADATGRGYTPCSVCKPPLGATGIPVAAPQVSPPSVRAPPTRAPVQQQVAAPTRQVQQPQQQQEVTVYVTRTGAKYHRDGCRYLSQSQIPMTLSDAKARYGPCSVCKPPN